MNQLNINEFSRGFLIDPQSKISRYKAPAEIKVTEQEFSIFTPIEDQEFAEWKKVKETFDGTVLFRPRNLNDRSTMYISSQIHYECEVENSLSDRLYTVGDSLAAGLGAYSSCDVECSLSGLWNKASSSWENSRTSTEYKTVTYFSAVQLTREEDYEFLKSIPTVCLSRGDRKALNQYRYEEELARKNDALESRGAKKRIHLPKCMKKVSKSVKKFFVRHLPNYGSRNQ